jgi:hypothetical protein
VTNAFDIYSEEEEDGDELSIEKTGQLGLSVVLAKHGKRDPTVLKRTVEYALSEYAVELRDGGLPNGEKSAERIWGIVENIAKKDEPCPLSSHARQYTHLRSTQSRDLPVRRQSQSNAGIISYY